MKENFYIPVGKILYSTNKAAGPYSSFLEVRGELHNRTKLKVSDCDVLAASIISKITNEKVIFVDNVSKRYSESLLYIHKESILPKEIQVVVFFNYMDNKHTIGVNLIISEKTIGVSDVFSIIDSGYFVKQLEQKGYENFVMKGYDQSLDVMARELGKGTLLNPVTITDEAISKAKDIFSDYLLSNDNVLKMICWDDSIDYSKLSPSLIEEIIDLRRDEI